MATGWWFVIVFALVIVLGVMLRGRVAGPEAPLRRWAEARLGTVGGRLFRLFCLLTVIVWLAIWATAGPDDRARLGHEFRDFLKSMEWGRDRTPGAEAPPAAPADGPGK